MSGGNQTQRRIILLACLTSCLLFVCLLLATVPGHDRHVPQVYGPWGCEGLALLGRLGTVAASHRTTLGLADWAGCPARSFGGYSSRFTLGLLA